jgi:hypothetical protein
VSSAAQFGIPSKRLGLATNEAQGFQVVEACSDDNVDNAAGISLPGAGQQYDSQYLSPAGREGILDEYDAQYTGRACRYSAAADGHTFFAHGYADADGNECTPFLPASLFSTAFVTPVAWQVLAFASDQPGTVTVGGTALTLEGSATSGVYKTRVGGEGIADWNLLFRQSVGTYMPAADWVSYWAHIFLVKH